MQGSPNNARALGKGTEKSEVTETGKLNKIIIQPKSEHLVKEGSLFVSVEVIEWNEIGQGGSY